MASAYLKFTDEVRRAMTEKQIDLLTDSFRNAVQLNLSHGTSCQIYHSVIAQMCKPVFDHKAYISIVYYDEKDVKKGTVYLHSWGVY